MRPTFMGFETAKTSIFVNQKSIDIVGNNLANLDTNGYTRQRVDRLSVLKRWVFPSCATPILISVSARSTAIRPIITRQRTF